MSLGKAHHPLPANGELGESLLGSVVQPDLLLLSEASVGSTSSSFESRGEVKSLWGAVWFLSWVLPFPVTARSCDPQQEPSKFPPVTPAQ